MSRIALLLAHALINIGERAAVGLQTHLVQLELRLDGRPRPYQQQLVALIVGRKAYWRGAEMPVIDVMHHVSEYYGSVSRSR
jgi:hypothetical protein